MILTKLYRSLFQQRFSWLFWLILPFAIGIVAKLIDLIAGDGDGFISGKWHLAILDTLFLLLFLIPLALWNKAIRLKKWSPSGRQLIVMFLAAFGIRLWLASLGGNYDMESFHIVSDLVVKGEHFYSATYRYNYGPVWAYIIGGLKFISLKVPQIPGLFHYLIVFVLFLAEMYISFYLFKKSGNGIVLLLFILNPVTAIITGFHSQFDVLAIAIALAAFRMAKKNHIWTAALLFGLSLTTKHIMAFFCLFWLFDRSLSLRSKIILSCVPVLLFLASFIPFYSEWPHIYANVFGYHYGFGRGIFMKFLELMIPPPLYDWYPLNALPVIKGMMVFWVIAIAVSAFIIQKYVPHSAFEFYLMLLVASGFAFSEQYLAIPVLGMVFFYRYLPFWYYTVLSSYFLIFVSYNNLKPQKWMNAFAIQPRDPAIYVDYTHIQTWLWALMIAVVYRAYKNKRNLYVDFPVD